MTTIAVANHKGGTAKTETVYRLARTISKPLLLIDLDSQSDLTSLCGGRGEGYGIGDVLGGAIEPTSTLAQAARPIKGAEDILIVPGDLGLENVAAGLQQRAFGRYRALAKAIDAYNEERLILLDCPPNAGIFTLNALAAAEYLLIPSEPQPTSIQGVERMVEIVQEIHNEMGKGPTILGTIATCVEMHLKRHQEGLEQLKAEGMPPLIGSIPKRSGMNADRELDAAYKPIADWIIENAV